MLFHFGLVSKSMHWDDQDIDQVIHNEGYIKDYLHLNAGVQPYMEERERQPPKVSRLIKHRDGNDRPPHSVEVSSSTSETIHQDSAISSIPVSLSKPD